jgi:hypothetical protein
LHFISSPAVKKKKRGKKKCKCVGGLAAKRQCVFFFSANACAEAGALCASFWTECRVGDNEGGRATAGAYEFEEDVGVTRVWPVVTAVDGEIEELTIGGGTQHAGTGHGLAGHE